jgi:GDPmannose 4,6-dehydratase
MLNQDKPKEYLLSSGEAHSVREFIEKAFKFAGIENFYWVGEKENEQLISEDKSVLMKINTIFYRPAEVDLLLGNSEQARKELNWKSDNSFDDLVRRMVENDIKNV